MKKALRWTGILLAVVLAGLQFVGPRPDNPPYDEGMTMKARLIMTPEAGKVFDRACRDCHSHETTWPWYAYVAPSRNFVAGHVRQARKHFNASTWGSLELKKAEHTLEEMCDEVRQRSMPLPSYLWLHSEARLENADVAALCEWTDLERARLRRAMEEAGG